MMQAEFVAVIQVLVYAGAIMVLFPLRVDVVEFTGRRDPRSFVGLSARCWLS
jgi:NADH:ubiquinone oxidoreductase subunit 6 (subunit J)